MLTRVFLKLVELKNLQKSYLFVLLKKYIKVIRNSDLVQFNDVYKILYIYIENLN